MKLPKAGMILTANEMVVVEKVNVPHPLDITR